MLARVAISDLAWLVILVPLGVLFQVLLLPARGYYACRRLGRVPALVYTVAVVIGLGWLLRLVTRRIGR